MIVTSAKPYVGGHRLTCVHNVSRVGIACSSRKTNRVGWWLLYYVGHPEPEFQRVFEIIQATTKSRLLRMSKSGGPFADSAACDATAAKEESWRQIAWDPLKHHQAFVFKIIKKERNPAFWQDFVFSGQNGKKNIIDAQTLSGMSNSFSKFRESSTGTPEPHISPDLN